MIVQPAALTCAFDSRYYNSGLLQHILLAFKVHVCQSFQVVNDLIFFFFFTQRSVRSIRQLATMKDEDRRLVAST